MKNILLILFICISINSFAQEIKFETETYDFGTITEGDSVKYDFKYTNTSTIPLELKNAVASCGCIKVVFDKKLLNLDQSASIGIVFNSTMRTGVQDKTINVLTNSKVNSLVMLHLKGTVLPKQTSTKILDSDTAKSKPMRKQDKLDTFNEVIDVMAMMNKTYWSLGVEYSKSEYVPVSPEILISDINSFINSINSGYEIEKKIIKKYHSSIDSTLNNMKLIGSDLGKFSYIRNSNLPLRFFNYKETSKLCFIGGIALDNVYNTLRLTSRQCARKVIVEHLITSIKNFKPLLNKEFDYVGFGATYGCKDLSDKYASTKEEYVAFIVSAKNAQDFLKGIITEDELVEKADIVLSDRDMVTGTKRIKIALE